MALDAVKPAPPIYDVGKLRYIGAKKATVDFNRLNRLPHGYVNLTQVIAYRAEQFECRC
jgi:hypothetical protein